MADNLAIDHDLYLLNNTTHGFLTAVVGLLFDGYELVASDESYAAYRIVGPDFSGNRKAQRIPLVTHINPETGHIGLRTAATERPAVSDAAQSFATVGFHRSAISPDVFICPLHKHAGLVRGLGLLAIKPAANLPHLRSIARMAEAGTADLSLIVQAFNRARKLRGHLVNRFVIRMGESHSDALSKNGISVVSPVNEPLPFVVVRGIAAQLLLRNLDGTPFTIKRFKSSGNYRISGAVRGSLEMAAEDFADRVTELLLQAPASRG